MRAILHAYTLGLLLAGSACAASSGGGTAGPDNRGTVRIENRSSSDMDIFVVPSLARPIRLGFVPASDTAAFTLAPAMLAGASSFRLQARPGGARGGNPVLSDPYTAAAGEEIFWSIPPQ